MDTGIAWNHPTIARLSAYIVDQMIGCRESADNAADAAESKSDPEFASLLDEIESLSDEETDHQLAAKRRP